MAWVLSAVWTLARMNRNPSVTTFQCDYQRLIERIGVRVASSRRHIFDHAVKRAPLSLPRCRSSDSLRSTHDALSQSEVVRAHVHRLGDFVGRFICPISPQLVEQGV